MSSFHIIAARLCIGGDDTMNQFYPLRTLAPSVVLIFNSVLSHVVNPSSSASPFSLIVSQQCYSLSRLNPFYYIIFVINALVVFHCQSCVADISGVSILVLYFTSMVTYLVCHTCCLDFLHACVCHMRTTRDLSRVSYRLLL